MREAFAQSGAFSGAYSALRRLTREVLLRSRILLEWAPPKKLSRKLRLASLLLIAGAFQIFDGVQAVASGALRGAGMTRWAMFANIVSYWMVGLPVSILLGFRLGWGPHGLWWGLTTGLAVSAVVLTVKFAAVSRRPIAPIEAAG